MNVNCIYHTLICYPDAILRMPEWKEEDKALLRRLYLIERRGAPEIAAIMGRGKGAIRMKITAMGLAGCGAT